MNSDVLKEGLEAIPRWIAFLDDRLQDVDAEAAQIQAKGTPPPPTSLSALFGGRGAMPVAMPHEEADQGDAALTPLPVAPESAPADTPATGAAVEGGYQFVAGETTAAATPPIVLPTEASAVAPLQQSDPTPAQEEPTSVPVAPTTAQEAFAQLETAWAKGRPERLPKMLREGYARRAEAPDIFAQMMVGARASGYLGPALARAVTDLIHFDTHFRAAEVLFQDPQFADVFDIAMEDTDYAADEYDTSEDGVPAGADDTASTEAEGEADRAADNGEEPF